MLSEMEVKATSSAQPRKPYARKRRTMKKTWAFFFRAATGPASRGALRRGGRLEDARKPRDHVRPEQAARDDAAPAALAHCAPPFGIVEQRSDRLRERIRVRRRHDQA